MCRGSATSFNGCASAAVRGRCLEHVGVALDLHRSLCRGEEHGLPGRDRAAAAIRGQLRLSPDTDDDPRTITRQHRRPLGGGRRPAQDEATAEAPVDLEDVDSDSSAADVMASRKAAASATAKRKPAAAEGAE